MDRVSVCRNGEIMEENQVKATAGQGGRYYPRKMRRGWCVAHTVTACGVAIERFGVRCCTYAEAFGRADRMNREAAEAAATAIPSAASAASGSTEGQKPDVRKEVRL